MKDGLSTPIRTFKTFLMDFQNASCVFSGIPSPCTVVVASRKFFGRRRQFVLVINDCDEQSLFNYEPEKRKERKELHKIHMLPLRTLYYV